MKYEITDIAHPQNPKMRLADAQAKIDSGEEIAPEKANPKEAA